MPRSGSILRSQPEVSLLSDIESLSASLGEKYEEIRMIHNLTASLELQDDPSETCEELLKQLIVCVKCETLIIQLESDDDERFLGGVQGIGKAIALDQLAQMVRAAIGESENRTSNRYASHASCDRIGIPKRSSSIILSAMNWPVAESS